MAGECACEECPQLRGERVGMPECIVPVAYQAGVGDQERQVQTAAFWQVMHRDATLTNRIGKERVAAEISQFVFPSLSVQAGQQVLDLALATANLHAVDHNKHAATVMHGTATGSVREGARLQYAHRSRAPPCVARLQQRSRTVAD